MENSSLTVKPIMRRLNKMRQWLKPVFNETRLLKKEVLAGIIGLFVCLLTPMVFAAGTPAGTHIENQVSLSYTQDGSNHVSTSNTTAITVAELLNVDVVWQDTASVTVNSGDTNRVMTLQITNTGNGSDDYTLAVLNALDSDQFDPALVGVFLDSNGNGSYDPVTDEAYIPGSNDPFLPADAALTVFILNDIPADLAGGDQGSCRFTVSSNTGTGTPGASIANAGDNGTDAIIGSSGGSDAVMGTYIISDLEVILSKSVVITDPSGGSQPVSNAILTYTITVGVVGSGTAQGIVITDPIPGDTTYNTGSLTLNTIALTDAVDGDNGDVGGTTAGVVTVILGDLTSATENQTITFEVIINP
jgi:uncharacterized repeat protein (TIGR01451 family)